MVRLVAVAQAVQHLDRIFDAGLFHKDRGKAALQGGVFLDVLVVLIQGGGAHALQLAARQGRLEHVGGIHGALGRAGADHGVQLVDEQDDLALGALDFFHGGLQALFELAAEARAGDHRAQVEREDALAGQDFGHIVGGDLLRQAFDDGGLAHAGFTDQHRVVLGAAARGSASRAGFRYRAR